MGVNDAAWINDLTILVTLGFALVAFSFFMFKIWSLCETNLKLVESQTKLIESQTNVLVRLADSLDLMSEKQAACLSKVLDRFDLTDATHIKDHELIRNDLRHYLNKG